jgi:hypothetical protein
MFHVIRRCGLLVAGVPSTPVLARLTGVVAATPAASVPVSTSCWAPGCWSVVSGGVNVAVNAPVASVAAVTDAGPTTTVAVELGV